MRSRTLCREDKSIWSRDKNPKAGSKLVCSSKRGRPVWLRGARTRLEGQGGGVSQSLYSLSIRGMGSSSSQTWAHFLGLPLPITAGVFNLCPTAFLYIKQK